MYYFLTILLDEAVVDTPETLALEEGQEPDLLEVDPLYHENFGEGKFILPLMHKLPMFSTTTQSRKMGMDLCICEMSLVYIKYSLCFQEKYGIRVVF
jgi:hypothetical protein